MKQIILSCLTLIIILLISGCILSPQTIAKDFLKDMELHNFSSAGQYVAKESKQEMQYIKERFEAMTTIEKQDSPKYTYKVVETLVEGEKATVTYQEALVAKKGEPVTDKPKLRDLKMVRELGQWKVIIGSDNPF